MPVVDVDFALLLYDEFDCKEIGDANVAFRHNGRLLTPIRKRDGVYVFSGINENEITLEIFRPHYLPRRKTIVKSMLPPDNPLVKDRLLRTYPGNYGDCDWVHGSGPPGTSVLALAQKPVKFFISEESDHQITVLGHPANSLVGKRFARNQKAIESFLILRTISPGIYLTDRALTPDNENPPTAVKAYLSQSREDGSYHIPVENAPDSSEKITVYYQKERGIWV